MAGSSTPVASLGTSTKGRLAMACGGLAIGAPMLGWIGFGIGTKVSLPDAEAFGALFAVIAGVLGVLGAIVGFVLALRELRDAAQAQPPRSRLAGRVALALVLLAPLTWALEWVVAVLWLFSSMPTHIL